jgi:hypothetical protein
VNQLFLLFSLLIYSVYTVPSRESRFLVILEFPFKTAEFVLGLLSYRPMRI